MGHDEAGIIIKYIWPALSRCPYCNCEEWTVAGTTAPRAGSPCARSGSIVYRRCANPDRPTCPGTITPYKVIAIAAHVDRGGDQSEIVDL